MQSYFRVDNNNYTDILGGYEIIMYYRNLQSGISESGIQFSRKP